MKKSPFDLRDEVNGFLDDGWEISGNLIQDSQDYYCQPIIKTGHWPNKPL